MERADMKPPATVIVGEVVQLHERLAWFERLPLFNRRICVTRAREQAAELTEKPRPLGADAIEFPVIELQPPADTAPLDHAIENLSDYDWLIFTSVNGVRYSMERLDASARDLRGLRAHICAIGPATRRAVEAHHLKVDLMPAEYVAESLVLAFSTTDLLNKKILIPRAAVARDLIPVELRKLGADVDVVEPYRNVIPAETPQRPPKLHRLTFTISSTFTNSFQLPGLE